MCSHLSTHKYPYFRNLNCMIVLLGTIHKDPSLKMVNVKLTKQLKQFFPEFFVNET